MTYIGYKAYSPAIWLKTSMILSKNELQNLSIADLKAIIDYCSDESSEEIDLMIDAEEILINKLGLSKTR